MGDAGRIAFRVEGQWWVAYWAKPDTMIGAIMLGSIRMSVASVPESKAQFIACMKAGLQAALSETTGAKVKNWRTEAAPEHERSGSA